MSALPRRYLFSVDEYHRMIDAGIFHEDDHIELIDGEIIQMAAIKSRHAATVERIRRLLDSKLPSSMLTRAQNPITLDDSSEPEPDVVVVRYREDDYCNTHPSPTDIILVIEVADTSLSFDRTVKIPKYALSSIQECWLINIQNDQVEVYKNPINGKYLDIITHALDQSITSTSLRITLEVSDIFPGR
ncbi:MAG: Uma2 family endonuclease [Acidobacteriota bacterium]